MSATDRRKWIALVLICATQFMVVLDVAIVNVALPSIQSALGFSQENLQWVVSAYTLTFGGFLLLGGRMADLLGPPPRLPGRAGAVLGGLPGLRPGPDRHVPDRRPRGPGGGRGGHLARRARRSS